MNPAPDDRRATPATQILALRRELQTAGPDAGPVTIAWHLERDGLQAPSTILLARGNEVTAVEHGTAEILAEFTIDPTAATNRKNKTPPVRRPGVYR